MTGTLPYREAAAVMLLNADGQAFVGQRRDATFDAWQMPQGGLDPGEDPLAGALRELEEETGITPAHVSLLARAPAPLHYDLPPDLVGTVWKGRYRGQAQHWFLFRFTGTDADINLDTAEPEFSAYRWVDPAQLPDLIVPFKVALYRQVLATFAPHL